MLLDRLLPLPGVLRQLVWSLPDALRPAAEPVAWVVAVDLDGRVVHDLRATDGACRFVTAAAECGGMVVAAGLHADDLVVPEVPG